MDHFYKDIDGWFDFQELYTKMVDSAPEVAHFVEVGVYCGCSAAYMLVEIVNSGKQIKLDLVDTGDSFSASLTVLKDHFKPVITGSVQAATEYDDASLDFVYIDADHSYESVTADINAWLPKIKSGGYLGGHDWAPDNINGIEQACNELVPGYQLFEGSLWESHGVKSWLWQKP